MDVAQPLSLRRNSGRTVGRPIPNRRGQTRRLGRVVCHHPLHPVLLVFDEPAARDPCLGYLHLRDRLPPVYHLGTWDEEERVVGACRAIVAHQRHYNYGTQKNGRSDTGLPSPAWM